MPPGASSSPAGASAVGGRQGSEGSKRSPERRGEDGAGAGTMGVDGRTAETGGGTELPRVIVAMNVGTLAYGRPDQGDATTATSGALRRAPRDNMNRLLEMMRRQHEIFCQRSQAVQHWRHAKTLYHWQQWWLSVVQRCSPLLERNIAPLQHSPAVWAVPWRRWNMWLDRRMARVCHETFR